MLSGNLMISISSSHVAKIETKYAWHQIISTNLINPPGHFKGSRLSTLWGALCSLKDAKHCTMKEEIYHSTKDMLFQKKRNVIISDIMSTHGRGPGECSRYNNSLWDGRLDWDVARFFFLLYARQDRPCGPTCLLLNGNRGAFPGIKRPESGVDHLLPSSSRWRMRRAAPLLPHCACMTCWRSDFYAYPWTHCTLREDKIKYLFVVNIYSSYLKASK